MTSEQANAERANGEQGNGEQVTVESALLGEIAVPAGSLFTVPAGLLGLEHYTRYALVPAGREGVFWLQSAEEPALAFVLADPFRLVDGYAAELPDADVAAIGAERPEDVVLLAVVTLPGAGRAMTANLRAPLAFNVATGRARQVVLPDDRFGTAEPIQL